MENRKKVLVITSGGFDPLHDGHIEYLRMASKLFEDERHICIVNTDEFLKKKKGYVFMDINKRLAIMSELKCIDDVIVSIDEDMTVCKTIEVIAKCNKKHYDRIVFAKGGDRFAGEIPESNICNKYGIEIIDGLGKKIASSSKLVENQRNYIKENKYV